MNLPVYTYETFPDFLDYEFTSEGPRGNIRKVVRFEQINAYLYNLVLGDLERSGYLNDSNATNNGDHLKVLATVASIAKVFFNQNPGAFLFITGNTLSRMRLYRIGINKISNEIENDFLIYGWKNNCLLPFEKAGDYDAFLVQKK